MGKAVDPVKGQSLANDPGQSNIPAGQALIEASAIDDTHVMQSLSYNQNEKEIRDKSEAGTLSNAAQEPKVQIERR